MGRRAAVLTLALTLLIGFRQAAIADPEPIYAIITGDEDTVIACWEGTRPIQPSDCIGRDVVAITSPSTGEVGKVVRKSFADVWAEPRAKGGFGALPPQFFAEPISTEAKAKLPEVPWPTDDDTLAVFVPQREQNVVLPFQPPATKPPFDAAKARAEWTVALSPSFALAQAEAPIWIDVDGDVLPEAIVIGRAPDDAACADLIVVHFARDGSLRDPQALASRRPSNACPDFLHMRDDCSGEPVPWPLTPGAAALALGCITSGGDGWQLTILPLTSLEQNARIAAQYHAVWFFKPSQ